MRYRFKRHFLLSTVICNLVFASATDLLAGEARLIKVLPQFLDKEGRQALTPSLYDRDAYQAVLKKNPEKRSALRFAVEWRGASLAVQPLTMRLELRGASEVKGTRTVEIVLKPRRNGWFSHWDSLLVDEAKYKELKEVTAWRVTLWDGERELSEQKSFLW